MKQKKKSIFIIILILTIFLSMTIVSATDNQNNNNTKIDGSTQHTDMKISHEKKITKNNNDYTKIKTETSKYVYVNNTGNYSSDGSDPLNPTTLSNAFKYVENDGTILLTGNEETCYDITSDINTNDIKRGTNNFSITSSQNSNVILRFYSGYSLELNGSYNIKISNISFTRLYSSTKPIITNNATLTLDNCQIYDTENSDNYGAITNNKTLTINNSKFYNNKATRQGGVIYTENGQLTINNSDFIENSAENGGVISSRNSIINVYNSSFNSNNASFGGVISLRDESRLYVEQSRFTNNLAEYNGGVIDSWYSTSQINNTVFINNRAEYGGIVYSANNKETKITNSLLEENTATINADNIYSYANTLTLTNNVILNSRESSSIYCYNTSYNINNNWWGKNNPNFSILTNNILPENWRLMNIKIENEDTPHIIRVSLNQLSNSKTINTPLYDRTVKFITNTGTFEYDTTTINNNLTNTYTGNIDDVIIEIDEESMKVSDKIIPYAYLPNINARINDNITITFKCNPDITENITLKINNNYLTNLTPKNGIATYRYLFNSTWKTGTYTLTAEIADNQKYKDTIITSQLTLKDNYNTSVTLVSSNNNQYAYENTTIPTRYNLSNTIQFQSSVKDQASSGSCWAFSTLAALESAYKKAYGVEYDFSENNMKNILKKYSIIGDKTDYPNGGNNEIQPISYLVGWYGPVLESEDSYDDYSIMSPFINNTFKVEDVYFVYRNSYVGKDNKALKDAILKYGALSSSIHGSSKLNIFNTESTIDHAITIVGWDDFYSRNNFYPTKPSGDGAYIIKNSWGTDTGENGYQYVSYYDTTLGGVFTTSIFNCYNYAFPVLTYENYTNIYQHDTISSSIESLSPEAWVRNVYTATKNESIAGVGTFIYKDTDYEAYIYVNDKFCYSQEGTFTQEGYRIIKLDQYVPIKKGDKFRVDLKLKARVGPYTTITLQNANIYTSISKANQSFISTDGEYWEDLFTSRDYKYSAACLKVYTKETTTINSIINLSDTYNITTKVDNLECSGRLSYKIDDEYLTDGEGNIVYVDVESNGTYEITIPYNDIEKYEYNITVILETDDITVIENITQVRPVNVVITTENFTYFVDDEQKILAKVEIEDNIYDNVLNSGILLLIEDNKIKDKCNVKNGSAEFIVNKKYGNHTYTLSYRGSYAYNSKNNVTMNITLLKHNRTVKITEIKNNTYDENVTIIGLLYNEDNETVKLSKAPLNVLVDTKSYSIRTDKKGQFIITHPINKVGLHNISITSSNNDTHEFLSFNDSFMTYKQNTSIIVNTTDTILRNNITINGKLVDKNNKLLKNEKIQVYVNDILTGTAITNNNGEYSLNHTANQTGKNTIKTVFEGNENYTTAEAIVSFIVSRLPVNISTFVNDCIITDNVTITGILKDFEENRLSDKTVKITINTKNYTTTTNSDGEYTFTIIPDKTGVNEVLIYFDGTDEYDTTNTTTTFTVNKINSQISINNITTTKYGDEKTINGQLTDTKNNPIINSEITITLNNQTNKATTDSNGNYKFTFTTNTTGINNITVTFNGNNYSTSSYVKNSFITNKLNTTLTINPTMTTKYDENFIISGTLKDEKEKTIPHADLTITINNKNLTIKTDQTGTYTTTITANTVGTNNITITYKGNETHTNTTTKDTFTVNKQDTTITLDLIKTVTYSDMIAISGVLNDINMVPIVNAQIILSVNEADYTLRTDKNGHYEYNLLSAVTGTNNVTAAYSGDQNYNGHTIKTEFTVNKLNTNLTLNQITSKKYNDEIIVQGTLKDTKNNSLKQTPITITLNNKKHTISTDNTGTYTITTNTKTIGQNTITVTFNGNNIYEKCDANTKFNVRKLKSAITLNIIGSTSYDNQVNIRGTLKDENNNVLRNSHITLDINGKSVTVTTNNNGEFIYTLDADTVGTNNVEAKYAGNNYITSSSDKTSFIVVKQDQQLTIDNIESIVYGDNIIIRGKLTDKTGKVLGNANIKVTVNTEPATLKTDNNGEYIYNFVADNVGTNNVTIKQEGNKNYNAVTATKTFIVLKEDVKITVNNISTVGYTDNVSITGKLIDKNGENVSNANLILNINGKIVNVKTDDVGAYSYTYKTGIVGSNNVTLSYAGSNIYNSFTTKTSFSVTKQKTRIMINNIKSSYNDNITITGTLTDKNGKLLSYTTLKLKINGKTVNVKTSKMGEFKYKYQTNKVGTNNITVSYAGNSKYTYSITKTTFKVNKLDLKLTVNKIKSVRYNENITVTGKFKDKHGKILGNSIIKLSLNGKTYKAKTNLKGVYKFTIRASKVGNNTIIVSHPGNKNYNKVSVKSTAKIIKQILKISVNVTKKVGYGSKVFITGKLTDKNGKVIRNTVIRINISGKVIKSKTNSKGIYNHSLTTTKLGKNNISVSYPGNINYNKISKKVSFKVVKQNVKVTVNSIRQVKGTRKVTITGKFMSTSGKGLRNSNVVLTLNGVKKIAKTNSKGVFTLTVYAKKGNNMLIATFSGNKYYNKYKDVEKSFNIA